ncbi:MAG: hypothetical protein J4215_01875 [Candidatus Diapherotrites archaeon]|uniref:Uncharacterized protein n=1 Tax=Candidatus Iainarchaeum sp. TaxID=3101447 RepID=A0A8T4L415_9ARCH|nr:hypothetical protein [Candidatus Diapherotrites archaeon]
MGSVKAYFIQYKFILPENISHSSYTYQKLFRALYGYTQNVSKSNGKSYKYHRKGILSPVPYLRPGKNCVIIPQAMLSPLIDFFKTGKNPSHKWVGKGDWKAVYYMNEKDVSPDEMVGAFENVLDRWFVLSNSKEHEKLDSEISAILATAKAGQKVDAAHKAFLLGEAQRVTSHEWFQSCAPKSNKLKKFSSLVSDLKTV